MKPAERLQPGSEAISCATLEWDALASGKHRVRYRRPDGYAVRPFVGSPLEAEKVFFESLADLQARVAERKKGREP